MSLGASKSQKRQQPHLSGVHGDYVSETGQFSDPRSSMLFP
jgi:hypothetical protein